MASARSSCKDLLERMPPRSPQDLLLRTCTGSCEDLLVRNLSGCLQDLLIRTCARSRKGLLEEYIRIFTQDLLIKTCTRLRKDQDRDNCFAQAWATEMHMDLAKGTICARIYKQSVADQNRDNRFVRDCAVKMHMSQEQIYVKIYRKNPQERALRFAQACAIEMHMYISHEWFYAKFYTEKPGGPRSWKPCGADSVRACSVEMHMDTFMREFTRKKTREHTLI